MLHSRCKDVETALQSQIIDLQERLRESFEMLRAALDSTDRVRESYARENMELHELLLAMQNPGAQRSLAASRRSQQPAVPLPELSTAIQAPRPMVNYPVGQRPSQLRRDGVAVVPRLTPEQSRFRPGALRAPSPPSKIDPADLSPEIDASAAHQE